MKSNYEHFVLTASCLKADVWSTALHHVRGRSALIFRTVTHPDVMMPAVPNHIQLTTVPTRGFWSSFCSWAVESLRLNFHLRSKLLLSCMLWHQSAAPQDLYKAYLYRTAPFCKLRCAQQLEEQGSSWYCKPWLVFCHCQGEPSLLWAGGAGTDHLPGFKALQWDWKI